MRRTVADYRIASLLFVSLLLAAIMLAAFAADTEALLRMIVVLEAGSLLTLFGMLVYMSFQDEAKRRVG